MVARKKRDGRDKRKRKDLSERPPRESINASEETKDPPWRTKFQQDVPIEITLLESTEGSPKQKAADSRNFARVTTANEKDERVLGMYISENIEDISYRTLYEVPTTLSTREKTSCND
jgi:hypothetical protein